MSIPGENFYEFEFIGAEQKTCQEAGSPNTENAPEKDCYVVSFMHLKLRRKHKILGHDVMYSLEGGYASKESEKKKKKALLWLFQGVLA